ncbi:MAG: hypothetical protein AB3N11_04095 [Arenibacterium sp.]
MDLQAAYTKGYNEIIAKGALSGRDRGALSRLRDLRRRTVLGSDTEVPYFFLPLAVAGRRLRAGEVSGADTPVPTYDGLDDRERHALSELLKYVAGDIDEQVAMQGAKLWLIEPLIALRNGLFETTCRVNKLPALDAKWSLRTNDSPILASVEMVVRIYERGLSKGVTPFEISATDPKFLDWLADENDPARWHQIAAGGLNLDLGRTWDAMKWIVAQPDCDPATVAGVFLRLSGSDVVGIPVARAKQSNAGKLLMDICNRADEISQRPSRYPLTSFGQKNNQTALARKLDVQYRERAVEGVPCVPSPSALFAEPFKGRRPRGWTVHSETEIQREV